MKKLRRIVLLSLPTVVLFLVECEGYLNVKPKDRYLEESVFSDRATIVKALDGIYLKLASPKLYGRTLSMGELDVMGQYYACSGGHQMAGFQRYDYTDHRVATAFSGVWKEAYSTLLNINTFIKRATRISEIISDAERDRYLGEAYGLRAMLHFDLLRIFGPVYTENADAIAIPYQVAPAPAIQPLITGRAVATKVLTDLDTAMSLLSDDPIQAHSEAVALHNQRFNHYAALMLDARVSLYVGNKERALSRAKTLIADAPQRFPWAPALALGDQSVVEDRLFSSEIVFGLVQPNQRQQFFNYFDPTLSEDAILSPLAERLQEVYEGNSSDPRYRWNWQYSPNGWGVAIPVFIKYQTDGTDACIPLMRIAEAFLIAAACEVDGEMAFSYLDGLNQQRNVRTGEHTDLQGKLIQAYRREFWGEGQLFFCYKRLFRRQLPNGNSIAGTRLMAAKDYVVPIPKDELIQR